MCVCVCVCVCLSLSLSVCFCLSACLSVRPSLPVCLSLSFRAHIQSIIDYGSTPWDSASANTLKPLVSLHKRALNAILVKNTTLAISDNNLLSIVPLKERLNYNKGVLIHKIMSGKVPPSLTANFPLNQSRQSGKLNIPIPWQC